jgi:hypothetical protein
VAVVLLREGVAAVQAGRPDRILRQFEAGREKLRLQPFGVGREQVEVDRRAQGRARVAPRDLGPLQKDDGLVGRRPDAGEEVGRNRVA